MRKVSALILFIAIISCAGIDKAPKPDTYFDKEKMAAVMTDVYLVEGAMSANRKAFVELGLVPDDYIYTKHGIDSISFKQNFNYYTDRVEDFIEVLDIVDKNLEIARDSMKSRQEKSMKDLPELTPRSNESIKALDSLVTEMKLKKK